MRLDPIPGAANIRSVDIVARADGDPIEAGDCYLYVVALTGANAGKWFKTSDNSWDAGEEVAGTLAHKVDGHWSVSVDAECWLDGVEYLEYAKESGDLHTPLSHSFTCHYREVVDSDSRPEVSVVAINGDDTDGYNATLKLAMFDVQNSGGPAISAVSTGGNGAGMILQGEGSGHGLDTTGGGTGSGLYGEGGSTSGHGIHAHGTHEDGFYGAAADGGSGLNLVGNGAGAGLLSTGGATGDGITGQGGSTSGHGLGVTGGVAGSGLYAKGGSTSGHGLEAYGTKEDGIHAEAYDTGHAMALQGHGTGEGLSAIGGDTGQGIEALGGASGGSGLHAASQANNEHGILAEKNGSGKDIDADLGGSVASVVGAVGSVAGNVDGEVASIGTDGVDADALKADAVASFNDIVKAVYGYCRGKQIRTGNVLAFKDDDGITTLFTLTIGLGGRTTA